MDYITVHYCPCGHTGTRPKADIPENILKDLQEGKRFSAPTKHSSECPECLQIAEERDARLAFYLG